jgi:hypothetical protein
MEEAVVVDLGGYGLAKPLLQYTLRSGQAGVSSSFLAQIKFGTNSTGKIFECRSDESSVNIINAAEFERMPRVSWQLRDRHVWNFETNDVVSVTIRQQGFIQKLIRDPNNEWTFAPGSNGMINQLSLEEALHRLGELKAIFWDGHGEENLERFGFAEAKHSITLEVKKGAGTEKLMLQFGKASPYLHPYAAVQLDGQVWVFEFPADLFREFVQNDLSIRPAFRTRRE